LFVKTYQFTLLLQFFTKEDKTTECINYKSIIIELLLKLIA